MNMKLGRRCVEWRLGGIGGRVGWISFRYILYIYKSSKKKYIKEKNETIDTAEDAEKK